MRPATWIARSSTPPNKNTSLMAKVLLSMPELRRRALAEIRQQPGGDNVQDIAINRVTGGRAANNWSLCVLSAGAADGYTPGPAALHPPKIFSRAYALFA